MTETQNRRSDRHQPAPHNGFTLIELMITVAIVAILAAVAYPAYTEQVAKGRRADARVRMMAAQQWMERFYTARYSYATDTAGTENTSFAQETSFVSSPPASEGTAMYNLAVAVTPTTYTITATRAANSPMAQDACGNLTLNNLGEKGVANFDTGRYANQAAAVAACWH